MTLNDKKDKKKPYIAKDKYDPGEITQGEVLNRKNVISSRELLLRICEKLEVDVE